MPDAIYDIEGDPRRLRLLKALTTTFEGISKDNGFKLDIRPPSSEHETHVFRGRAEFGEGDPVPMISILEAPIPPDQQPSPEGSADGLFRLELVVQGFSLDDKVNPTDAAHHLLAAAKRALALEKKKENMGQTFGFKWVSRIEIGPGTVRPPDEISAHAYFWQTLVIVYADDMENTYDD